MINTINPAFIFIFGATLIPLLRGKIRNLYLLFLPVLSFLIFINIPEGVHCSLKFLDYNLILLRVDKISTFFSYIYHLITFIAVLYSLHVKEAAQHMTALTYAGSSLGVVFAGDLLTLFIFWELMVFSAFYLIWASRTKESYGAGLRYLLVHIFGGLCLLTGIVIHLHDTGSLEFSYIGLNGLSSWLIFISFGLNCAFPGLHAWLPDAYPRTTPTGGVFMWTFTTKTAVYVLARGFYGTELLIWIGAVMTVFPIFFAVIENDLRKVLSYSLINQLGYMVTGIGIGTQLSLNGTFSHVFCHILYKALLVMSMGAVLYRTGKIKCTDLGGLYKSMPLTTIFCIVGSASISAFPLFSGFVSKSMVVEASAIGGLIPIWFMLTFASVGVLEHAGIKVPYYAFFSTDSGIRTKESPKHMLFAMGITAFLCIFIGVFPCFLYTLLPYPVEFEPYTASHVVRTAQLLFFGILAYVFLMKAGLFPKQMRAINLDLDWFYRKSAHVFIWFINKPGSIIMQTIKRTILDKMISFFIWFTKNPLLAIRIITDSLLLVFSIPEKRNKIRNRLRAAKLVYPGDSFLPMPIGVLVLWSIFFLLLYLIIYYARGYM